MEVHLVNNDPQNLTKNKDVFVDDLIKLNDGDQVFWAIIQKKLRNCLFAKIDNKLLFEKKYNYGDIIKCKYENIIDSIKIQEPKIDF